uniref:Replication-associated protein n=1 Tax=Genomoviridae sp. TaxID=2202565 RepID=A0A858NEW3_9VIRU|nr:MAG: replication-associated protein [Genomoviridae sp.]
MSFRFAAKYGLFTYAQCGDLNPFAVVDHFASLRSECIIGREMHADGGVHLHAFAMWEQKYQTRDVRKFDVLGCHPNVVAGYGTPEKGWDYATKDGEIVAGGLERPCGDSMAATSSKWSEVVLAETADEFWSTVARVDPRALCCSFISLQKYAEHKFKPTPAIYGTPPGISFDTGELDRLPAWVNDNLGGTIIGRPRSLCLYGDTRLGKTLWARSLGKHAYFGGLFSLDEPIEDVDYAVFDDINGGLKFFPNYKSWLGCQSQFYCTDKYKTKKLIHWSRPCIWLSNEDPRTNEGVDIDWLEGNCEFVHIRFKIFRASTPSSSH